MVRTAWILGVALCVATASSAMAGEYEAAKQALADLEATYPQVRMHEDFGQVTRVFGTAMSIGSSTLESAEAFRRDHAAAFGVAAEDLAPVGDLRGAPVVQPLMFDIQTGEHKFELVKYTQQRDGVPVFGGELRVLVRDVDEHPVVMAASSLRNVGTFTPAAMLMPVDFDPAIDARTGMERFSGQRTVIWAGTEKAAAAPTIAVTFIGEAGDHATGDYQVWRFVVDASNGEVLSKENLIRFVDVAGTVSGNATQGPEASQCAPEAATAYPYAYVEIAGGGSTYADADGNFVIPNGGSSSVTVNSYARGTYFRVLNYLGSEVVLSQAVTPPGPVDFLHNAANTDEYILAQANGYVNANEVRDWLLYYDPAYPTIATQTDFPVYVNRTDGYCPGNAWYDSVEQSINFCSVGDIYGNTSFASVSQHEFGHHIVEMGGSGQDEYGEGMSDCIGMLVADDPGLGYGFYYDDCVNPLRNADNNCQYTSSCSSCGSTVHTCGQLLSGCVWDLRTNLAANYPATYMDIVAPLTIASIQLHSGTSITPAITNDFLVLDDDDGDLSNGTPHSVEILDAFGQHNMVPGPPPENDNCVDATPVCPGAPVSGSTADATDDGSSSCGDASSSPDAWHTYTPETGGTATFSLCSGTNYDAVLSVHTGCPGSGSEVGCDDDGCGTGGGPSTVTASVTAGVTYYIRVTGWQGSVGDYTLEVTGPNCQPGALTVTFPNGTPGYIAPGGVEVLDIQIADGTESYVTGSATLHYRLQGGAYQTAPLTALGGEMYQIPLTADCGDTPEFYVSAMGDGGATVTNPDGAPAFVHSMTVSEVYFADDFETDQGWTASNPGGITGGWQRGVPVNDSGWDYDPYGDGDGSGQCWLTQNVAGNTDVDGGAVQLTSPVIDMSGADVEIRYLYYLYLTDSDGTDRLLVEMNNNGGSGAWYEVARHDVGQGTSWTPHTITQADLDNTGVTRTANMMLRFTANDGDTQSIVEAGVDGIIVVPEVCEPAATCDDGILNQDEERIDCGGPFCSACECTGNGDCDDGLFCTGTGACDAFGMCSNTGNPCGGMPCDEVADACLGYCAAHDVDCNGSTDAGDILVVRSGLNWNQPVGSASDPRADVDGDGTINAGDILVIRGGLVWNTSTGPCVCP